MVWREAREKSDFMMYAPHLKKMIEIKKQIAEKIGYEKHPYDALLDTYEEELTVDVLDKVFGALTSRIQKILKKLIDSGSPFCKESKLGKSRYDIQKVDELNHDILTLLQYDMERFRMDVSTHPFTEAMDLNDVRITTRYEGTDFKRSISSTIHEAGHALYNLQCDQSLSITPLEGGSSLALHESQSRFWENVVGRSLPFVQLIAPLIRKQVSFVFIDGTQSSVEFALNKCASDNNINFSIQKSLSDALTLYETDNNFIPSIFARSRVAITLSPFVYLLKNSCCEDRACSCPR